MEAKKARELIFFLSVTLGPHTSVVGVEEGSFCHTTILTYRSRTPILFLEMNDRSGKVWRLHDRFRNSYLWLTCFAACEAAPPDRKLPTSAPRLHRRTENNAFSETPSDFPPWRLQTTEQTWSCLYFEMKTKQVIAAEMWRESAESSSAPSRCLASSCFLAGIV